MKKEIIEKIETDIDLIKDENIRIWSKNYLHGHIDHYKSILKGVNKIMSLNPISNFQILDVGGVPSHIDAYLKNIGHNVEIVDLNPLRIKEFLYENKLKSYKVDIEQEVFPIDDNNYDIVLFNEVLEHLRIDPLNPFKEIARVLKPKGNLLFSTPNITPFMRWEFFRGKDIIDDIIGEYEKMSQLGHMGHFRLYSQNELSRILNYFNLIPIESYYGGKIQKKNDQLNRLFINIYRNKMKKQIFYICRNEKSI